MTAAPAGVLELPPVKTRTLKPNRALFLDIDGVLCTARAHLAYGVEGTRWHEWDPLGCQTIRRCCQHDVQLVISSTWRYPRHEPDLMLMLSKHGLIDFLRRPNWKTPDISSEDKYADIPMRRGMEVEQYLAANQDITHYRILDDVEEFLPYQNPFVIRTHEDDGMTTGNIRQLMRWAGALQS